MIHSESLPVRMLKFLVFALLLVFHLQPSFAYVCLPTHKLGSKLKMADFMDSKDKTDFPNNFQKSNHLPDSPQFQVDGMLHKSESTSSPILLLSIPPSIALLAILWLSSSQVALAELGEMFDPTQFQPVCPASDKIYQILKGTANTLVGSENVVEYGPLIASVLLRVRLELCVLESFLYEAVIPFVRQKGFSWVLPLHETVETFIAGTIFAVASNFILLGSTKIIAVLLIYADTLTGMPTRFIGDGFKKFSKPKSGGELFGTLLKIYGNVLGTTRSAVEKTDTFVGRYLVLITSAYIAFKFAHYKFFNDLF